MRGATIGNEGELSPAEARVWRGARVGEQVDFVLADKESGRRASRSTTRNKSVARDGIPTIRAELIAHMLIGDGLAAGTPISAVWVRGARITGQLDLEAATLRGPLTLKDCQFERAIILNQASAPFICLSGSHVPACDARQLVTRGNVELDAGFTAEGELNLEGAHVGGKLLCSGGHFGKPEGTAINGDDLIVGQSLFCDEGFAARGEVSLVGAHIGSDFLCSSGRFSNARGTALNADRLELAGNVFWDEGFTSEGQVSLVGAHIGSDLVCSGGRFMNAGDTALDADRLELAGNMFCDNQFDADGEVSLVGAHITGSLTCSGGRFRNPPGIAIDADGLTVGLNMYCNDRFSSTGELRLGGAHIGGDLQFSDGRLRNPNGIALNAGVLLVNQNMYCDQTFTSTGEVLLVGAHVRGDLQFSGGQLSNVGDVALDAGELTVDQNMYCDEEFSATGEVRLIGAHVGGKLEFSGGQLSNAGDVALNGSELTVDQSMFCNEKFSAIGEVRLIGAHIGGRLQFSGSELTNTSDTAYALNLEAIKADELLVRPTVLIGKLNLKDGHVRVYKDASETWPTELRLNGFAYDSIEASEKETRVAVEDRLRWLELDNSKYLPQTYDQLASAYRRAGWASDAERVSIARERRRRGQLNPIAKVWNVVLDRTVGYGYKTWQAGIWLLVLLAIGTALFNGLYPGQLSALHAAAEQPPFNPFLYTLDLLLPVINLHQNEAWNAHGPAQWFVLAFRIAGWILTTAIVLSLSGILKRE